MRFSSGFLISPLFVAWLLCFLPRSASAVTTPHPKIRPPAEVPSPPPPPVSEGDLMQGFLPKEDLGILDFLARNPTADGRGIVVAILDTGVDLAHPALQQTSIGGPKILDVYDATDNGYLAMPVMAKSGSDPIRGLSGRILHLPADVPAGTDIRLGIMIGPDIFPGGLSGRRAAERKAEWERAGQEWAAASAADTSGDRKDAVRAALEAVMKKSADPGDRFDVVAIARGEGLWEVRIDTNADGDLANETPLHPYHEAREVARFGEPLNLSMALDRIAPDGSSLFLFFDEGAHGTHVAGIVAGFYGAGDPLNGLAPGAQLLAVKVGNGALGGSTSHNSIMKAAQWAVDHGADVINLSFGGDTFFEDGNEEIPRFFDDLVERTGVVICASAGNSGPALSTVGAPATARRIFSWGASISKKTQETNYGALEPQRDELFQFSSRGPLLSGDPGVDFISPGAALSSLPPWLLISGESWNGTSMASPQGAGFCAAVLSACREEGIPVTPDRLRRAMRAGARLLPGITAVEQGDGLPQAEGTLDALRTLAKSYPARSGASARIPHDRDATQPVVGYVVQVQNATGTGGGYYERDLRERSPYLVPFFVTPDFPRDSLQAGRAAYLRIVRLESDVPWLVPPITKSIASDGAVIQVRVDPAKLAGGLNVGRVFARDVRHPEAGCEFALLATVIRPEEVDPRRPLLEGKWDLQPGDRRDVFVRVPPGASVARVTMQETLADPANAYEVALAAPDLVRKPSDRIAGNRLVLAKNERGRVALRVLPGSVLEVVAYSRWHTNRTGRLEWRIEFDGIDFTREPASIIEAGRPGVGVVIGAPPWGEQIRLSASLDHEVRPLDVAWRVKPDSLFTSPLAGVPAMVQEGVAQLAATGAEKIEMDLRIPPESEDFLDDAYYRVFDDSGRRVANGYLTAGPISFDAPHAGAYRIFFAIPARGSRMFDAATVASPVLLENRPPIPLVVYRDPMSGFERDADSLDGVRLVGGERRRFFLRAEDLPGGARLVGSLVVRGEGEDAPILAEIPIEADTRASNPGPADVVKGAVASAIARADLLSARADAGGDERAAALRLLEDAERLRTAIAGDDADRKADGKKDGATTAPGSGASAELWDLRVARTRLLLRAGDTAGASDGLDALRKSLPEAKENDPSSVADRRAKEAVADALGAELAWEKGDVGGARKLLDAARALDPDVPGAKRCDALLLSREGKEKECRDAAKEWLESHPDDREIDRILVESYLRVGWWDLASLRLASWPLVHPGDEADLLRLWSDTAAARAKAPALRSPITAFGPTP